MELATQQRQTLLGKEACPRPPMIETWAAGLVASICTFATGMALVGHAYNQACEGGIAELHGYHGCVDGSQFAGIWLMIYSIPLVCICLGTFLVALGGSMAWIGSGRVSRGMSIMSMLLIVILVMLWVYMLQPTDAMTAYAADILWVPVGSILVAVTSALAGVCIFAAQRCTIPRFPREVPITLLVVGCGLWAFLVFLLPPLWRTPVARYWARSSDSDTVVAEPQLTSDIQMHIFQDHVIWFTWLGGLILFGISSRMCQRLRLVLSRRLNVAACLHPTAWYNPFPLGTTVGELLLVSYVAALYCVWFWFWRYHFDNIQLEAEDPFTGDENQPLLQVWARTLGHMTSLSLSLLAFPVARNSVWDSLLGVSFERALRYHRGLGVVTYLCVTAHMLVWWIKWGLQDILWHNLFTWAHLEITPLWVHYDNVTIPLVEVAWLMLTGALFLALRRRDNYHVFKMAHRVGLLFYVVALFHAWCFWYYALGGLVMLLFDYCIRISKSIEHRTLIAAEVVGDLVHLQLAPSSLLFRSGQFVYLAVPELSLTRWHPFSISSTPRADAPISLHIQAVGDRRSFTRRLHRLVGKFGAPTVLVDGPYGSLSRGLNEATTILLIAGGIGLTPLHSIYTDFADRMRVGHLSHVQRLDLVWTTRDARQALCFHDTLRADPPHRCKVSIHLTGRDREAAPPAGIQFSMGRPDLRGFFRKGEVRPVVVVCGPPSLVHSVSEFAFEYGYFFKSEPFGM